jgi:kynurenine formamidase
MDCNLHSFTHVDSLLHFMPGKPALDRVPLDKYMGEATVVNLSHLGADAAVSGAELEKHGQHVRPGDIVLLRTDWPLKCDISTRDFWSKSPYTAPDACRWLVERKVKMIGYDYSPEYANKYQVIDPEHKYKIEDYSTHLILFPAGIFVVEYLCNLHLITKERFQFMALPIPIENGEGSPPIENGEGSPVRAIAFVE